MPIQKLRAKEFLSKEKFSNIFKRLAVVRNVVYLILRFPGCIHIKLITYVWNLTGFKSKDHLICVNKNMEIYARGNNSNEELGVIICRRQVTQPSKYLNKHLKKFRCFIVLYIKAKITTCIVFKINKEPIF